MIKENKIGVIAPHILLPKEGSDYSKWAVVACDQYTSQPDYWAETEKTVGDAPSTLRLILPELYLDKPDEEDRIKKIRETMDKYMADGTLRDMGEGFMLIKRTSNGRDRLGLVLALDLEMYDYSKGSGTLIRATEGTIVERIPPRLRIRKGAPLELPHIIILIDDEKKSVIEPLYEYCEKNGEPVYDFDLMQNGGHIKGYFINDEEKLNNAVDGLEKLSKKIDNLPELLFALGDGNHSFATAKANWEEIKKTLSDEEKVNHPARYALVELENVHDEGIIFEPIHRVLFNVRTRATIQLLKEYLDRHCEKCEMKIYKERDEWVHDTMYYKKFPNVHTIPFMAEEFYGVFAVLNPEAQLEVGTLQVAIDAWMKDYDIAKNDIDYVHGDDVVEDLASKPETLGFLLPPMGKDKLFSTVMREGALPRKTFSMGEANEKRYYLECRKILG